jgi:hypothetical protein
MGILPDGLGRRSLPHDLRLTSGQHSHAEGGRRGARLVSPEARIEKDGRDPNRKGALGYYATVRSGDHWYMISVSDMLQPYHNQWWADRVG